MRAFVTGIGVVSPAGTGVSEFLKSLERGTPRISPLGLFPVPHTPPLPVGEISSFHPAGDIPRTHALAMTAAEEALKESSDPPDAVLVGTTTGGILTTETLLGKKIEDPERFRYHTPGTVGEYIAGKVGCQGPVLTVSTACASGTTVMKIALQLIRTGMAGRILVVGADSLCRLTYHGFSLLQLVDPAGARPFDRDRAGMSVAEAAAALLVETAREMPAGAFCELRGGGLSCDAYHVTAPDKDGRGAASAMKRALEDAEIGADRIDYINLHGTGTPDNDAAEAKAVQAVFGDPIPALSSTKGIYGHPLAAAGTVEAVIGALCIANGIVPANTGFSTPDPDLGMTPLTASVRQPVKAVLSNSFGFGGNNACIVLADPQAERGTREPESVQGFRISGSACLTGAGTLNDTWNALEADGSCRGMVPDDEVRKNLDPASTRRLKRLPCLTLALAVSATDQGGNPALPGSVYFGTGLGAMSETLDFLVKLTKTQGKFSSPTDFVGSLHNSPAGQVALHFKSRGPNIATTGTDDSFEQALCCAGLLCRNEDAPLLCIGADEANEFFSTQIDPSTGADPVLSDGGGALLLEPEPDPQKAHLLPLFLGFSGRNGLVVPALIHALGGPEAISQRFGAIFAGIPHADRNRADEQLSRFLSLTGFNGTVVDYRQTLGHYAAVSAVACALAWKCVQTDRIARGFVKSGEPSLDGKGILMLGLGPKVSAVAMGKPT